MHHQTMFQYQSGGLFPSWLPQHPYEWSLEFCFLVHSLREIVLVVPIVYDFQSRHHQGQEGILFR
ncbi:hypothetical protein OIU78_016513 [Salix suchowensis]|nr:hypothetical protein OIU78_016513 [Salix suchowensis]